MNNAIEHITNMLINFIKPPFKNKAFRKRVLSSLLGFGQRTIYCGFRIFLSRFLSFNTSFPSSFIPTNLFPNLRVLQHILVFNQSSPVVRHF